MDNLQAYSSCICISRNMKYCKLPDKFSLTLENYIWGQTYNNSKSTLSIFKLISYIYNRTKREMFFVHMNDEPRTFVKVHVNMKL